MYEARLPSSKLVSPHPDSRFDGSYTASGRTVEVDGWHGMQGHNWGTRHAELYAWSHCNQWDGHDDLVLEGVTARVKVGPVLAPPLTLVCVRHRGVRYDFNAPLTLLRARGTIELRRWTFSAKNALATVSGELWARHARLRRALVREPGRRDHLLPQLEDRARPHPSLRARQARRRGAHPRRGARDRDEGPRARRRDARVSAAAEAASLRNPARLARPRGAAGSGTASSGSALRSSTSRPARSEL